MKSVITKILMTTTLLSAIGLTACASLHGELPTDEELVGADYGSPISQQEAVRQAKIFLQHELKDPGSAMIDWGPIKKGWTGYYNTPLQFGYVLSANINAKNSYGGYTGYQQRQFCFLNGVISRCLPRTGTKN